MHCMPDHVQRWTDMTVSIDVCDNRQNCGNSKVYFGKYVSVPGPYNGFFWSLVLEDNIKIYEGQWTLICIWSKM